MKEVAKLGTYVIPKDGMRIIPLWVHFQSGVGLLCEGMFIFYYWYKYFMSQANEKAKGSR